MKKIKSFTLLELLITIIVSSLLVIACLSIFHTSYSINLNQRKQNTKFQEIDYVMNYIEQELKDAIFLEYNEKNISFKKLTYNGYIEKGVQKIAKINEITFKITDYNGKYDIDRISKDTLDSNDSGVNKLIKGLDNVGLKYFQNKIIISIESFGKSFEKIIHLEINDRFNYIDEES